MIDAEVIAEPFKRDIDRAVRILKFETLISHLPEIWPQVKAAPKIFLDSLSSA